MSAEIAAQRGRFLAVLLARAIEVARVGVVGFIGVGSHEWEWMGVVDIICSVFEALRDCRRSRPSCKSRSRSDDRWMPIHGGRLDRIGWPWQEIVHIRLRLQRLVYILGLHIGPRIWYTSRCKGRRGGPYGERRSSFRIVHGAVWVCRREVKGRGVGIFIGGDVLLHCGDGKRVVEALDELHLLEWAVGMRRVT